MILKIYRNELRYVAYQLFIHYGDHKIWLLEGKMGSGKTTLIKELCRILQTVNNVKSPTFSIINEYETIEKFFIYHFDCYRVNHINDAILLDFESYFVSGSYCFIEWPSKIISILPVHYFLISIKVITSTIRHLTCTYY